MNVNGSQENTQNINIMDAIKITKTKTTTFSIINI
jgi:hypothetical protein